MTTPGWFPPAGARTRLVLVRHGSTEHSPHRRFSGRTDLPLAPQGEQQAAALAARDLAAEFGPFAAVVSSPLRRCRQTAAAIAGSGAVLVVDELVETDFGAFEGLTAGEARREHPDGFAAWTASPDTAPPDGESFTTVDERVGRARNALVAGYPDGTLLVVTHVTPIKLLVRFALDASYAVLHRLYLDTASVSVIDVRSDGSASLRLFNDTSHLR